MRKSLITILMIQISWMNPIWMLKIPMKVLVLVDLIVSVVLFYPLLVDNHPIASAKVSLVASGHLCFVIDVVYISSYRCFSVLSIISAPPGYGEDYGTLNRMYTSYGLHDDDYHSRRRSPSVDTEFRGKNMTSCSLSFPSLDFASLDCL